MKAGAKLEGIGPEGRDLDKKKPVPGVPQTIAERLNALRNCGPGNSSQASSMNLYLNESMAQFLNDPILSRPKSYECPQPTFGPLITAIARSASADLREAEPHTPVQSRTRLCRFRIVCEASQSPHLCLRGRHPGC